MICCDMVQCDYIVYDFKGKYSHEELTFNLELIYIYTAYNDDDLRKVAAPETLIV